MVKHSRSAGEGRAVLSPGLTEAPVLDRMCSHFVLALTMSQAGRFNPRRDWNSLLSLTGRHLVWPAAVLRRLRDFLDHRCRTNDQWRGHEALSDEAFIERHGHALQGAAAGALHHVDAGSERAGHWRRTGHGLRQQQSLEEPGGMRQVPLGGAGVGHGLRLAVGFAQRRGQRQRACAHFGITS